MENVLFKYSDFFQDDGGFDKIRNDFDKLGDDLMKKAKELKNGLKLVDTENVDAVKDYEAETESLMKTFKKYGDAKEEINKIEKAYLELKKKDSKSSDDQINKLTKLDKELAVHRSKLAEINTFTKQNIKTDRDLNKERVEAELNIKRVRKEITSTQTEILKSNELSREEQKLLKAKITLEKTEIKTLDDVRERISALRVVVQSLDLESEADKIQAFNNEINELTGTLSDNSDKFIQSKINIGNYEESIVNALKSSDLFKTNIGFLDGAIGSLVGALTLTTEELDAMEKAMTENSSALQRFTVSFGKMNKVLKASVIGLLLVALAGLSSLFGDTRAGAVRMEKVMTSLGSAFVTFGKVSIIVLQSIGSVIGLVLNGQFKVAKIVAEQSMKAITKAFETGAEAIVKGLEYIDKAFKIEDNVRRLNREIEVLNGKLAILQTRADDSTTSLKAQLNNTLGALKLQDQIGQKQLDVAKQTLDIANNKIKQNVLANVVEAENLNLQAEGVAFAEQVQDLAQKRGVSLEIANDLIVQQQDALIGVIQAENQLQLSREENLKKQREIQRDIFEQNLDLLIDLIDTEKNISEKFVNNTSKNFKRRIDEFNRFLIVFRQNSQKELDEFTKFAKTKGLDLEFQIQYDENGDFEIFIGDQKLATDNIVELNKQLQSTGMSEIEINRFREFVIEARNGVNDFRDLNKELTLAGIKVKELSDNLLVDQNELNELDVLNEKILKLKQIRPESVPNRERKRILKELESLEKEKQEILAHAQEKQLDNRLDAINEELKLVENGSERELELLREKASLEKQIRETSADRNSEAVKTENEKAIAEYEKFVEDLKGVFELILDQVSELNQKRVESAEKQVDRQTELIDVQRRRAEEGLTNTLAFEQRELGRREADLIKQQKRQERLEKVKALYSSYNNYASQGDQNPITKALRDFAILEAITASFKDGGITGIDGVKTNNKGITLGRSHNSNGMGGNLAWHESGEGFFSRKEVDNMGHDNFYKIKSLASMGKIDSNFFSKQRKQFTQIVPFSTIDPSLIHEMREVKNAINSKPTQNWKMGEINNGMMSLVEEVITTNGVKRNHHIVKRPRT